MGKMTKDDLCWEDHPVLMDPVIGAKILRKFYILGKIAKKIIAKLL